MQNKRLTAVGVVGLLSLFATPLVLGAPLDVTASTVIAVGADPLLAVEASRGAIIDRLTADYAGARQAAGVGEDVFRATLAGLRADQLLAASLVGSFAELSAIVTQTASDPAPPSRYVAVTPTNVLATLPVADGYLVREGDSLSVVKAADLKLGANTQLVGYFVASGGTIAATSTGTGSTAKDGSGSGPSSWIGFVAGNNAASGSGSAVAAGTFNVASGLNSFVGAGQSNVAGGISSLVIGGFDNQADAIDSLVGAGAGNRATGARSVVIGGGYNLASGNWSFVGGGGRQTINAGGGAGSFAEDNVASGDFSVVTGGQGNRANVTFATVAGGDANVVDGNIAFIGGGNLNRATGLNSVIVGGDNNLTKSFQSAIGGGSTNTAGLSQASGVASVIAGGRNNTVTGNLGAIVGGELNSNGGNRSFIGGGGQNSSAGSYSTIAGGGNNTTGVPSSYGTIGGGFLNVVSDVYATVSGGQQNRAGNTATVGGGTTNQADALFATIGGGYGNIAEGPSSTVIGGYQNAAFGDSSVVLGGAFNTATGLNSIAAGVHAVADQDNCFVVTLWGAYGPALPMGCAGSANLVRFGANHGVAFDFGQQLPNGDGAKWVRIGDSIDILQDISTSSGAFLSNGGTWTDSSDRNKKHDFVPVAPLDVLARVVALPISTWSYIKEPKNVQHMGAMAQDFYATFGLGADDLHISPLDTGGVALAAIQGLHQMLAGKDQEIADLKSRLAKVESLREEMLALKSREVVREQEVTELRQSVESLLARTASDSKLAAAH